MNATALPLTATLARARPVRHRVGAKQRSEVPFAGVKERVPEPFESQDAGGRDHASDRTDRAAEEAALLDGVSDRKPEAMAEIYDRYSSVIYSVALRILREPSAAEDVLQEVLMQLWRNPGAYVAQRGSLCAWLAVVARNRAIDVLRRRRPEENTEDVVLASPVNYADLAERNHMVEKVRAAMSDLPEEQRHMLELAYFEGQTHTEIASQTGDPLGTVKTRIRTALLSLRKVLQP